MKTLKIKKIGVGTYETTINDLYYLITKNETTQGWTVTCGEWGNPEYWKDTYSTKKDAVQSLQEEIQKALLSLNQSEKMLKHSKGPWIRKGNASFDLQGRVVAEAPCYGNTLLAEEQCANAWLITAAPEMAQALERILKAFPTVEGLNTKQSAAIGAAMNALHNAKGRT